MGTRPGQEAGSLADGFKQEPTRAGKRGLLVDVGEELGMFAGARGSKDSQYFFESFLGA